MFFTVVQVVVLNSCVDRFGFVVVGEWRDRGTTEAIVLVVFCLLFFLAPSWRATRVTSGSPSVVVLITCSCGTRCQAPQRHHIVFFCMSDTRNDQV